MIEHRNSRLNIIFVFWFLAVAVLPSAAVALFAYAAGQQSIRETAVRSLATASRFTEHRVQQFALSEVNLLHTLVEQAAATIPDGARVTAIQHVIDAAMTLKSRKLFSIGPDGTVHYPRESADTFAWIASRQHVPFFQVADGKPIVGYYEPGADRWLIAVYPPGLLSSLVHQDINDVRYVSQDFAIGGFDDIGSTADVLLLSAEGFPLSDSLMQEIADRSQPFDLRLSQWLRTSRDNVLTVRASLSGRDVLLLARRAFVFGSPYVFLATIEYDEIAARLYGSYRAFVITYILALVAILAILYIFVRSVTNTIIRPIQETIRNLMRSSSFISQSVSSNEKTSATQARVADTLQKNYESQAEDLAGVNHEISEIASSLEGISTQTRAATKNVTRIDTLAAQGEREATEARESITSIKRLSTAHEVLLATLQRYSEQVDAIAADVRRIANATNYLSLNATIEASKVSGAMKSVSSLVSEVSRLTLVSKDATVRINELVTTIQNQLQKSKETSSAERKEAESSIVVIDKALRSLEAMSHEAKQISQNVRAIDEETSRQAKSTEDMAGHAKDLTVKAKGILRGAARLNALVDEQQKGTKASSSAVVKLADIVSRLSKLIGARRS
ncbi:MAG: hypothetical protein A3B30_02540 [Candidatus Komeilibacteria bacterium RIFCSPLOWO2_01_FULL_52_15]|uniref:Methyl-accepting transducer domain-containing protein n=2 Tax=Candidatus Komeiliibacteriota TaxID=1817908 RepID=A0A1G2BQK6_9BACT|nr:MAG: hypothetical protein A2677_01470 [Candidatus Komeilibacteria bacterium RIFCSPHIGHO2_01_FULL_52_14]OGY91381.1 MAG: hypothetical protein A3B30_02540 [Candidatus Komeilibacteria bacterium RIFCSPLOWO2_01_FULL_52_15]